MKDELENTLKETVGMIGNPGDLGPYRFTIRGTDTDYHDRLHLFSLFSFMQEAAYHNAEALKIGAGMLDEKGFCWLLIRISVRLHHLPHWGETITVDTWSRGTQKLVFLRDFDFYDQNGVKFGCATSEWLIARKDTHRPQRPDTLLPAGHKPACTRAVFSDPIPKPAPLAGTSASQPIVTQYADFSDIDRNKHVNNTRYIAWCMDTVYAMLRMCDKLPNQAMPADELSRLDHLDLQVGGIDIHYVNEVRLGTKIHCFCQHDDSENPGEYLVEARRADDDATVFRARVLTI